MNEYIMLGRFRPNDPNRNWRRPERTALIQRVLERTTTVRGTRIKQVRLTLGRFDVVIHAEAESHNAAFDLASAIQDAAHLTIETMPVATQDDAQPANPPPDDRGEETSVREPNPTRPGADSESAHAQRERETASIVDATADVVRRNRPATRPQPRR